MEKRYYLLDTFNITANTDYKNMSDDDFIDLCEKEGNIYSEEGFIEAFNAGHIDTNIDYLRIIQL